MYIKFACCETPRKNYPVVSLKDLLESQQKSESEPFLSSRTTNFCLKEKHSCGKIFFHLRYAIEGPSPPPLFKGIWSLQKVAKKVGGNIFNNKRGSSKKGLLSDFLVS